MCTLIDLIVTSDKNKIKSAGTFDTGIADHSLVYAILKLKKENAPPQYQWVTNMKQCNWAGFNESLRKVPWMACDIFDDPDDSLWAWNHLY